MLLEVELLFVKCFVFYFFFCDRCVCDNLLKNEFNLVDIKSKDVFFD